MCKSKQTKNFKRDFKYKTASVNIAVPDVYCDKLGQHYACFLGENKWCEKRALRHRMEWS